MEQNHTIPILDLSPEEIGKVVKLEHSFQALQIFKWLSRGASSFDEMSDLSLSMRKMLKESFLIYTSKVEKRLEDASSCKLAIELFDGSIIEAVLLRDEKDRVTACLSSQVGCPLSCAFCKTGKLGYKRNLKAFEIIEEFHHLTMVAGKKIENIVFMGMGEPLLNIKEVKKAINILTHPKGLSLSRRRITISTAGLIEEIKKLAGEKDPPRLAVSLTVADPKLRLSLMPIEKTNPLPKLKDAIKYFNTKTNKRVTLEVALIGGVNTSDRMIKKLVDFTKDLNVLVNLIPWNHVEGISFTTPSKKEINMVEKTLKRCGVNVTIRKKRAGSIAGSCGQLGRVKIER